MLRTTLFLILVLAAASALALSRQSAVAHNWVPIYNGVKWAQSCSASAGTRTSPSTCCEHARFFCQAACDLADVDNGWKSACKDNCQSAGLACLQNVQTLPPVTGVVPGKKPPAATN